MNALNDKEHTQGMPQYCDMQQLHNMASFNNHIISSSGTPVGTKFTATQVGMIVEYCGHVMELVHTCMQCGTPCLCTLSASAFIESSLHQLDLLII